MKRAILMSLLVGLLLLPSLLLAQSTGTLRGRVLDQTTHEALPGANVLLVNTPHGTSTDARGTFVLMDIPVGTYTLRISFVGYAPQEMPVQIKAGSTTTVEVFLEPVAANLGEIVVTSVSRRQEKVTEAPATVQVINAASLERVPGFAYEQAFARLKGVDFVRTGITGIGINARGFNSAFNTKMLLLTDWRRAVMPGVGLPFGNMNTTIKEDIDRIEVVLGPSSALYGPNAHNGLVNVVTKDPHTSPGTTVAIDGGVGGRDGWSTSARLRHAQVLRPNRLAFKLYGEYTTGHDFTFVDTVYNAALGALPETPDFTFRHIRGGADVYITLAPRTDLVLTYSGSRNSALGVTNVGRNQIKDWTLQVAQVRLQHPHLFAQVYHTWSNSGKTHSLNNKALYMALGFSEKEAIEKAQFVDKSSRTNAEFQANYSLLGFDLVGGFTYELEKPVSEGTYLSDTTGTTLDLYQYGLSGQVERRLLPNLRLVAAARYDVHENYGDQFSPKLGLVYSALRGSFRLTYGKAFVAPTILQQEIYIPIGNAGGIPIVIRGNARGFTLIDGTEIPALKPEVVQTWEVGYKGLPLPNLYVDINAYRSNEEHFITPLQALNGLVVKRGNVAQAPEIVLTYQNFGKVLSYGVDLGLTYYLSPKVTLGATYSYFYANLDKETFDLNGDGVVSPNEMSVNTPEHKGSVTLTATDLLRPGFFASLTLRGVSEYDFVSGVHFAGKEQQGRRVILQTPGGPVAFNYNYGPLGGFVTVGLLAGYRHGPATFSLAVDNLLNTEQREFVASPPFPRFVTASLTLNL